MKSVSVVDLGITQYKSTWDLQHQLFDLRVAGSIGDVLLLNEHHHVYTLGKSSDDDHLLASETELQKSGAEVFHIDRGGDITYHGPGQLVCYPILDLNQYYADVHRYLRDLEEVVIRTLAEYDIHAHRDGQFTGVWVENEKIAAVGVKTSHWVTMHGFAFNVNTDLSYFEKIIPCGIFHKGVTSVQQLLNQTLPMNAVSEKIIRHFGEVFGCTMIQTDRDELLQSLQMKTTEITECLQ